MYQKGDFDNLNFSVFCLDNGGKHKQPMSLNYIVIQLGFIRHENKNLIYHNVAVSGSLFSLKTEFDHYSLQNFNEKCYSLLF